MGNFSIWHWIIVLIIVMLVFGTKKLRRRQEFRRHANERPKL